MHHRKQAIFTSGAPLSPGALGGAGSAHLVDSAHDRLCFTVLHPRGDLYWAIAMVVLEELSQTANPDVVRPRFWRSIAGRQAAPSKAWQQHGQAGT